MVEVRNTKAYGDIESVFDHVLRGMLHDAPGVSFVTMFLLGADPADATHLELCRPESHPIFTESEHAYPFFVFIEKPDYCVTYR